MERQSTHLNITIGVTSILSALLATNQMKAQPAKVQMSPAEISGIQVIAPEDNRFNREVENLVDPSVLADIRPILPFTFVLRNVSTKTIIAYSTEWILTDQSGKSVPMIRSLWWNLTTIRGGDAIDPGESRLVSPIFRLGVRNFGPTGNALAQSVNEYLRKFEASSKVQPTLDAVIFEDGRAYGPDHSNATAEVQAFLEAERAVSSMSLADASAALTANSKLDKKVVGPFDYPPTYEQCLEHSKRRLIDIMQRSTQGDPAKLQSFLDSLREKSRLKSTINVTKVIPRRS